MPVGAGVPLRLSRMARNRRFLTVLIGWAGFSLFFAAWLQFQWGGGVATQRFDNLGETLVAFVAAAVCGIAGWRHQQRTRIAWALIGASALFWGVGQAIWSYYELVVGQQVPFPSFADLGFLGAVPLAVAGSLFIISWATVLGTVYRTGSGGLIAQLIGLAYPAGDIVIGTIVLILASRAPKENRLPFILLAGGLVANLLADSAFAYLTTTNTYGSGSTTDTGWAAGYLLIAVAGFRAATTRAGSAVTNDGTTGRIWLVLPYLPIALAAIVAVFEESLPGQLDPVVFWAVMALIIGVVVRQYLMLTDNQNLNRRLEANASDLAKREQHLHALVQNSSDVITLIDQHGAIQYQSASVERILGYRETELVGQVFGDLVHPDDRTQALRKIDEAINIVGPPIATECRLRRVDDS